MHPASGPRRAGRGGLRRRPGLRPYPYTYRRPTLASVSRVGSSAGGLVTIVGAHLGVASSCAHLSDTVRLSAATENVSRACGCAAPRAAPPDARCSRARRPRASASPRCRWPRPSAAQPRRGSARPPSSARRPCSRTRRPAHSRSLRPRPPPAAPQSQSPALPLGRTPHAIARGAPRQLAARARRERDVLIGHVGLGLAHYVPRASWHRRARRCADDGRTALEPPLVLVAPPNVLNVSSPPSTSGGLVTIHGENLGSYATAEAAVSVHTGLHPCTVVSLSAGLGRLVFEATAGVGSLPVRVVVDGIQSSVTEGARMRYPAPRLDSVTPPTGATEGAVNVTIAGRHFGPRTRPRGHPPPCLHRRARVRRGHSSERLGDHVLRTAGHGQARAGGRSRRAALQSARVRVRRASRPRRLGSALDERRCLHDLRRQLRHAGAALQSDGGVHGGAPRPRHARRRRGERGGVAGALV